jgi:PAS domain S-box-containing protein
MKMPPQPSADPRLRAENAELRVRLEEAEEMLRAIRSGEVDALVVEGEAGPQIFTLQGLDAQQNRFRGDMLAQVSDAVVGMDTEDRITFLNAAAEHRYGVRASDVLGCELTKIYTRQWPSPEAEAAMRTAASERGEWRGELIHRTLDGRELHVETSVTVLLGPDGERRGMVAATRDVTGRKQLEREKAEALRLLDTLLTHAPVGFAFFDRELRFVRINERLAEINGYSIAAHLGRPMAEILPTLAPALNQMAARILATGQPVLNQEFTGETARAPGVTRYWNGSWYPAHDERGEIIGFGAVVEDITERRRAEEALQANEERMRLATAATGVGIWEWNLLTGFIRWDAQMFRLYGVAPTADGLVSYETWRRALLPEDLAHQEEVLADTVRRLGKSTREFRILRADTGETRWIQSVETVRANEEGKAEWVVGTNLDVTARKNAERAIREEAQRKDEFLAMLGHELRNPLNAIRNAVQIGVEAPQDRDACQWAASVIDRQSQQLSRMVDDLLDVARINRGRIELRVAALDLGPVLEQAIAVVRPLLARRRQILTSDIGSQLRVTGDAPRLQQVFVNLLTNAVKYTPDDGRISLHARSDDGEVVVAITDNGAGISAELLPHIFDLFRQADSTLDRALGGLGIGLNVVKSLVEMHLGRVTVESAGPNAGTTATVSLPALLDWPAAESPPAARALDTAPDAAPPKPLRVLIVDDHIDAAETLETLLRRRGCEARRAHSGPAGVAAAREFHPEVLLLDLGLPGFDGYEVARILRVEAPFADALFIAISG